MSHTATWSLILPVANPPHPWVLATCDTVYELRTWHKQWDWHWRQPILFDVTYLTARDRWYYRRLGVTERYVLITKALL